jgi:hypothetical protein
LRAEIFSTESILPEDVYWSWDKEAALRLCSEFVEQKSAFEIPFVKEFQPVVIGRHPMPAFDDQFTGKSSDGYLEWVQHLHVAGYSFWVSPDLFVLKFQDKHIENVRFLSLFRSLF